MFTRHVIPQNSDMEVDVMVFFYAFQEGSSHDRGLYARCYEELFDLANSDATATSRFDFSVTVFELHNEQVSFLFFKFL